MRLIRFLAGDGEPRVGILSQAGEGGTGTVTVLAAFGNVDVYATEGVNVDVGGLTVFGHCRDWGHDAGQPDRKDGRIRMKTEVSTRAPAGAGQADARQVDARPAATGRARTPGPPGPRRPGSEQGPLQVRRQRARHREGEGPIGPDHRVTRSDARTIPPTRSSRETPMRPINLPAYGKVEACPRFRRTSPSAASSTR